MIWGIAALVGGFFLDLIIGDPHGFPHPIVLIGRLIAALEVAFRKIFPQTPSGERVAGAFIWLIVVVLSVLVPVSILWLCKSVNPWLGVAVETIMCWQILATKSLRDESTKVYDALESGDIHKSRYALSMIVGRDTAKLTDAEITRATVETVAENTTDAVVGPLLFLALGGAPLGFFYKAVNTMDSMLGYIDPPYKNIGFIPAKADDIVNFFPARISAFLMLIAGVVLRLDVNAGIRIFFRDRFNHKSPNSAQTESVCAGLLHIQLAGDAYYHGILHKKKYIGDAQREIEHEDILRACSLMYITALLALLLSVGMQLPFML